MLLVVEQSSLLDKSISIVIVLFITSLISERFITWFKLYFFKKGNTLLWIFFNWEEDYSKKSNDPILEKERERRILLLNIVLSIVIALLAHIDLFKILQEASPFDALGWKSNQWAGSPHIVLSILKTISGCILGGLFISLGSKFWHDTLEMLFYARNLKQKLSDPDTYNSENINQFDDFLSTTNFEIASLALEKVKEELRDSKGFIGLGVKKRPNTSKFIIEVLFDSSADLSSIKPFVTYKMKSGKEVKIPIEIKRGSIPIIQVRPADSISNAANPTQKGSVSCIVKDNDNCYILTCYHNVIDPNNKDYILKDSDKKSVLSPSDSNLPIGDVVKGILNDSIDAAIIGPVSHEELSNKVPKFGEIESAKDIFEGGEYENLNSQIYIRGLTTKGKFGYITHMYFSTKFNYGDDKSPVIRELKNLFTLSNNGKRITKGGDSGAPVLDDKNNILGIVVGGNDEMSFAIPINTIFSELGVSLKS